MEKKRTEKFKGDLAKTEEDLANLRKVSLFTVIRKRLVSIYFIG